MQSVTDFKEDFELPIDALIRRSKSFVIGINDRLTYNMNLKIFCFERV